MLKIASRVAAVSAATVVMGLIPLAGTSYAAGCYSTGCDNQGPKGTGCESDAVGHGTVNNNGRIAELRWSNNCKAAWVRTTQTASPSWYSSYATIEKYNRAGKLLRSLSVDTPNTYNSSDWSNMLGGFGGDYFYRACVGFYKSSGAPYGVQCTDKW
ncbi:DUF2690 domain-containing protein [Streptomyces luteireticuli]|uniref:DUF2690 domain-containing protein n=1 Tax=Streptomyces luteireticuli TaxID=173858 RepID=A0ABN0YF34_9ACTN